MGGGAAPSEGERDPREEAAAEEVGDPCWSTWEQQQRG